jgi:orotidine-5'-phosphate decarboxylase
MSGAADPSDRLIVALDHPSLGSALSQVEALGPLVTRYKVGLELYSACGPLVVSELVARGKRVFLDLKLHDIPETAHRAARAIAAQKVELMTVHAAGGRSMMTRAVAGARSGAPGPAPRVLAVTVLTSLERKELAEDGHPLEVEELVVRRARLAEEAGCDGVIASPREVQAIRRAVGSGFFVVTPGVRPSGSASASQKSDDQRRTATAAEAVRSGADAVVVGRPIRDANDPREAVLQLCKELEGAA